MSGVSDMEGSSLQELKSINTSNKSVTINFKDAIQNVREDQFNKLALDLFYYQAKNNPVYSKYLHWIGVRPETILHTDKIPYLPIQFFKNHKVSSVNSVFPDLYFESSSTGKTGVSRHYIFDSSIYKTSLIRCFEFALGPIKDYTFRFLLPSYLERGKSSLVYMANHLLEISGRGGFYLHDHEKLSSDLKKDLAQGKKVLLLGVSFALLDFATNFPMDLHNVVVMETGGMKGRGPELTRMDLHAILKQNLNLDKVGSEYGMTELLSQAYALKDGRFICPPQMKVAVHQTTDPFTKEKYAKTGQLNIMDLANIESCCFIGTSDLGRMHEDGSFEVMGRFDNSEVRGCNLMYE